MRALMVMLVLVAGCFKLGEPKKSECPDHASTNDWLQTPNCQCPLVSELGPGLAGRECTMPNTTCYGRDLLATSCTCVYTAYQPSRWSCGTIDMSSSD
jgi:hypothetical protein